MKDFKDVQKALMKLMEIVDQLKVWKIQVEIWMTTHGEKAIKSARDGEVQMVNGNKNAGNLKTMVNLMVRFSVPQWKTMAKNKAFGSINQTKALKQKLTSWVKLLQVMSDRLKEEAWKVKLKWEILLLLWSKMMMKLKSS